MLDVHPPHEATHTWKDFFIHIATIVVGLIIAVGLEQTVEMIHHRHLRHELEANMRSEAQRNVEILSIHLEVNVPNMLWDRAALIAVRTAPVKNGFIDVALPPRDPRASRKVMTAPERNVWPAAKAAGTVMFLPNDLAQVYAQLDLQSEFDDREVDRIREASALLTRFELATGSNVRPESTLHVTPAQRDQLLLALSTHAQSLFDLLRRDNLYLLTCQGVLQGVEDTPSMIVFIGTHPMLMNQYR